MIATLAYDDDDIQSVSKIMKLGFYLIAQATK
jgi:hypothetical protein